MNATVGQRAERSLTLTAASVKTFAELRETIRVLLLSHELKPWREKNVVRAGAR